MTIDTLLWEQRRSRLVRLRFVLYALILMVALLLVWLDRRATEPGAGAPTPAGDASRPLPTTPAAGSAR